MKIIVDVCKCNYCGKTIVTVNDVGQCPKGCPGNMHMIKAAIFEIDPTKNFHHNTEFINWFNMNKEYDEFRNEIENEEVKINA